MTCVYTPPQSPSPFSASPSAFLPPRPSDQLSRRPSALRHASSDHIITHAVPRFSHRTTVIPDDDHRSTSISVNSDAKTTRPPPPGPSASSPATVTTKPKSPPSPPLARPALPTSVGSSSSLLSRRRSSRSAARADVLPMLNDLKLEALPSAGLEELDDTVRPQVVGESSAAVTPSTELLSPGKQEDGQVVVVAEPFKSTKKIVRTPFPMKRTESWLSDEDEDEDEQKTGPPQKEEAAVGTA
ncbi:hypothetical protein JCM11251_006060 [Rhodosporidiobolus azoricus]